MSLTEILKWCPHCGPGNSVIACCDDDHGGYQVWCGRCGSSSGRSKVRQSAIDLWNTRVSSEAETFLEADYSQWVPLEWWNHIKALIVNRVARHKELGKVLDISLRGKRPPPSVERTIGKAVEATLVKLLDEMIELEKKC